MRKIHKFEGKILFDVPGGKWDTSMGTMISLVRDCSCAFHKRQRVPLLPPPPAVTYNTVAIHKFILCIHNFRIAVLHSFSFDAFMSFVKRFSIVGYQDFSGMRILFFNSQSILMDAAPPLNFYPFTCY